MHIIEARERVEAAALDAMSARHYPRPGDPYAAASVEHADEKLALAARDLVRAVEALPEGERPVGWDAEVAA